ncbi:regulator of PEP synthase PpsR (kinase-PPPase family) [Enterococcus sp. PF1-24]|uniref:pyruvate, water dikinase regulatory protein n=1 Tax=unclassified Enterococcus TaxID=2608891 RepID=UPI0024742DC8|nr:MULTISPECIES: pyruvate, water dikinase regulatory protein [unclassified Enterococcus]MDH6365474.1 regulator of PEP synthase PpsR (kinase-PPPase family) [Enterococcus sp. PFB1-1]MDH6402572.1 regulator of PEP synthase PpsR (kinase-PPPase family) [Enterococcus sp. PF1-24]
MKKAKLYLISDSVGETAQKTISAVAAQFPNVDLSDIQRYPFTNDEEHLLEILKDALLDKAIVVTTLVNKQLVDLVADFSQRTGLQYVDFMTPLSTVIEHTFGEAPLQEPGALHRLNQKYFSRVAAMEFAVKYDDGKDAKGFLEADFIILGVSRTSKTPLSMYMANRGFKVANLPLIPEVELPKELFEIDAKKIVGLTTSPESLVEIRKSRMHSLGLKGESNYTNEERIEMELNYAHDLFDKLGILVINVDKRSIEESSVLIEEHHKQNA